MLAGASPIRTASLNRARVWQKIQLNTALSANPILVEIASACRHDDAALALWIFGIAGRRISRGARQTLLAQPDHDCPFGLAHTVAGLAKSPCGCGERSSSDAQFADNHILPELRRRARRRRRADPFGSVGLPVRAGFGQRRDRVRAIPKIAVA